MLYTIAHNALNQDVLIHTSVDVHNSRKVRHAGIYALFFAGMK